MTRLRRLGEKETRRLWAVIFAGKMLGVIAVLGLLAALNWYFRSPADAVLGQVVVHRPDVINPLNTVWVLLAAFLVFFMQAGFMALEAGFARSRETVNILLECIVDTCLCGLLFWAIGFAFMFGEGNGLIGHQFFFLNGAPATYGTTGVAFLAFFLFQFAFADTCSTITSGAMVGRTGFKGDLLYSFGVSGFIYPIFGHWVWGPGGWLGNMTPEFLNNLTSGAVFRDFAGSTVVHTVGGGIALAGWDPAPVEVVGCTAVDGKFLAGPSIRALNEDNDGLYVHEFAVPQAAKDGATICEEGVVIGLSSAGEPRAERSGADCFTVVAASVSKPAPAAPAASRQAAAAPPASAQQVVTVPAPPGTSAGPAPAADAAPAAPAPDTLPRTGAGRVLAALAGLLFVLGGLAVAGSRPLSAPE